MATVDPVNTSFAAQPRQAEAAARTAWEGLTAWADTMLERHTQLVTFFDGKSIDPTKLKEYKTFIAEQLMEATCRYVLTGGFTRPADPKAPVPTDPNTGWTVSGDPRAPSVTDQAMRALTLARQMGFDPDKDPQ